MSKAKRKPLTGLQRAKFFEDHGGICHICGEKIKVGEQWEIEHIIPFAISDDDSDQNKAPAHKKCHRSKTSEDQKTIAKGKRVKAKHIGAWPKSSGFKTNRNGPFKAKIGGGVERRD